MIRIRAGICSIMMFMAVLQMSSQDHKLSIAADHQAPNEFLVQLSQQSGINIIYNQSLIDNLPPVTLQFKNASIEDVMKELLKGSGVSFRFVEGQLVLYKSDPSLTRYSITGVVTDSVSGEPLIYAYVYDAYSGKSTSTNNYGFYSLNVTAGTVSLFTGYAGYASQNKIVDLNKNQFIYFHLAPSGLLPEVVVQGNVKENFDFPLPAAQRISMADLQSNIQLGGASDLYRVADFIPGVHTGTDGVGGIHVRGGANDQNLILMDGVPVYHPNHLLGIVSVFNYQVVQQASIYKANFPSRFSGRLSSVMDVRTREGNISKWDFSGNVGLSEVGVMAEGPLVKEKISVLLSGRFFLPGLFLKDLTRHYKERNGVDGFAHMDYYDYNGKINWKISERDRIYLSSYRGNDRFSDSTLTNKNEVNTENGIRTVSTEGYNKNLNWTNQTGVFRWNHILNEKVFANLIFSTSSFVLQSIDRSRFRYTYPDTNIIPLSGFDTKEFKSSIKDVTGKLELDIIPSTDHELSSGIYGILYTFLPKSITLNEESKVGSFFLKEGLVKDELFSSFKVKGLESGVYLEDKWDIQPGMRLTSGVHISAFFVQGTYYLDPQLRMSFDYQPDRKLAFNAGYSRMAQYLHNLTSSSIGLPTDLWVPTTSKVSPALSDQYSVSGSWKPDQHLTVDLSGYIKNMRSLISYQEGASFQIKEGFLPASIVDAGNWESKITVGDGHASGVELQFIYDLKKLQFNLNGTWSKSYRRFDDINSGIPFPDRYDRRWSATFSGQYKIDAKWSCGVNFIYGTGIAITLAESKFFNPGEVFPEIGIVFSDRNGYRLPAYHRLDITLNYQFSEAEKFSHSLSLNLYNVYNRVNPFYITLVQDTVSHSFQFRQFSLFRFFPISYLSVCLSISHEKGRPIVNVIKNQYFYKVKSIRISILMMIASGFIFLSACETTLDYQANIPQRLTIVSQITPNGWEDSPHVYVYASQSPSDSSQFYTPDHLDVNVTSSDTVVQLLSIISNRKKIFLFPQGFLKTGLTYTIEANAPGFQTVEATTTIPIPSTITDLTIKTISIEPSELNQFKNNIRYTLQFKINHTEPNRYYHLVFYNSYEGLQYPYLVNPELSDKQPFIHHYEYGVLLNRSDVKDDQTLIFNFIDWTVEGNDLNRVYVELRSITEEYYKYQSSLARQLIVRQDPFAEPVTIFNNIEGGYGNFSGFATSVTSSDLPK